MLKTGLVQGRASILLFALIVLTGCGQQKLSKDDLRISTGDIRTFAAATSLLAEEQIAGKLTNTFFASQAEILEDRVHTAKLDLDSPGGDLEYKRTEAVEIASHLEEKLSQMVSGEVSLEKELYLSSLANEAKSLEDSLKDE
ncbi:MAG: hypothetical protein ACJ72Z_13600 [Pyrinomonadaceae bacterium]